MPRPEAATEGRGGPPPTYRDYLAAAAVSKETIEVFLDPTLASAARYHPITGYEIRDFVARDGVDGSATIVTVRPDGSRRGFAYADRPCRINTYGDSYTQGSQVSDGETWQEVLAAHLAEPVRNFGVGGFGVYQAYRRMVEKEGTEASARHLVLLVWGDDHMRSLMRCRHASYYRLWDHDGGRLFHNNFWSNVEMDLATGGFGERPSLLPTPESVYRMTEPDFMVESLADDLMLQLSVAEQIDPASLDREPIGALARHLGVEAPEWSADVHRVRAGLERIRNAYGFAATAWILERARRFCEDEEKTLTVLALCPRVTRELLAGRPRYDQPFADFLAGSGLHTCDVNLAHLKDYRDFALSPEDYLLRYHVGHYNPAGNLFFAFAVKDSIASRLDPPPLPYRAGSLARLDYGGYLGAYSGLRPESG